MALKVFLSPTAKLRLEKLLVYLRQKWSEKVKQDFIERFDLVTKQTTFYYRIKGSEIEIAALFDTRQDPEKLNS